MQQLKCADGTSSSMNAMYTPVPYNIDLALYVLTKTQEDALQIIEQILPTFTPEYTLTINAVPDMNVKMDVPIILNNIAVADEYDGDFQTRRFVTHTLNFQMKVNLYGGSAAQGIVDNVTTNIGQNETFAQPNRTFTADGDITTFTVDTESWINNF